MMKNFSGSPLHSNEQTSSSPSPSSNHFRERNNKQQQQQQQRRFLWALPFRFSLRNYGFCMASLFLFCFGSLFYQQNGGPPEILLDIRQYLGKSTYLDDHRPPPPGVLPFPSQVVYNRVGKCGSRTVIILLRLLAEKHQFNLVSSDIHNKTRLTKYEEVDLMKNITSIPQPYLFTRHVHYLNFTRFRAEQPVYINIIRDPINRFVSNYFFRRFGDWRGEQNHLVRNPTMKDDERYLDINVCILRNYPECSNPRAFYIIPYFCGQHPHCRDPGVWALERAKENVMQKYLLVGILEELEDVLVLLERLLPHYFTGVLDIFKSEHFMKMGNMTGTVLKYTPTVEAMRVLYARMRYEYQFYDFVRSQFHLMKAKIGFKSISKPPVYPPAFLQDRFRRTEEPPEEEDEELDTDLENANSWLVQS